MSKLAMDSWIFQFFGLVLVGAGLILALLMLLQRARRKNPTGEVGIPGNLPPGPGINISRVVVGGDVAGLILVIWVLVVMMLSAWGWVLAVAAGAVLVALALLLWHRFHPW